MQSGPVAFPPPLGFYRVCQVSYCPIEADSKGVLIPLMGAPEGHPGDVAYHLGCLLVAAVGRARADEIIRLGQR